MLPLIYPLEIFLAQDNQLPVMQILSTILFTISWPLLGSSTLSGFVIAGLIVELTGVIFYQRASSVAISKSNVVEDDEQLELLNETIPNDDANYGSI